MTTNQEEHSSSSSSSINSIPKIKLTFKEPVQPKEDHLSTKQSLVPPPKSKRQLVPKRAYHRKSTTTNGNSNSGGFSSSKNLSVTEISIGKPGRRRKRNKESCDSNGKNENSSTSFISSSTNNLDGGQNHHNFTDESNGTGNNLESVNKAASSQEQQSCLKSNFALQRAYKPKWTWRLCEVEMKTALAGSFKSRVWKKIPINHH